MLEAGILGMQQTIMNLLSGVLGTLNGKIDTRKL